MPIGINKVVLVGHLGGEPDIRAMPSGATVANFSLATSERFRGKDGGPYKTHTEWHRAAAFGRLAENVRMWCHKGSQVYIEGSLRTRKWQDKNGQDRWTTEIVVKELLLLGGESETAESASQEVSDPDIPW